MSPIDELLGESAMDRFFSLLTLFLVGLWFGAGFWFAYRWLI